MVREKKKRYGIPKLEENLRLKLRTEDRMMIARAKENLWKRFREKEEVKEAIRINHLKHLKEEMTGKKLEKMKTTDMRKRRDYTKLSVEECRMAVVIYVNASDAL